MYGNKGYIGNSRSVRSQDAIDSGLVTFSQLKAWQKRAVNKGVVSPCEWHHTGKYYNKTQYYNPEDFEELNPSDFPLVKAETATAEKWFCLVSAEWGGTRKHPKITGVNVLVTNKPTSVQLTANKYSKYGGYIETFTTEKAAREYAQTAELRR